MSAWFLVEKCLDPVVLPGPAMRNVKHTNNEDYDYNYDGEDAFNVISFQPKQSKLQARASRGGKFQVWEHYIAIEEITWDYAPHLKPTDRSERWRKRIHIYSTISDLIQSFIYNEQRAAVEVFSHISKSPELQI